VIVSYLYNLPVPVSLCPLHITSLIDYNLGGSVSCDMIARGPIWDSLYFVCCNNLFPHRLRNVYKV
jgi:hypothetical protein